MAGHTRLPTNSTTPRTIINPETTSLCFMYTPLIELISNVKITGLFGAFSGWNFHPKLTSSHVKFIS